MRIELDNVHCSVHEATDNDIRWLRSYLTFIDERKSFVSRGGRAKRVKPPKVSLFDDITWEFPSGLLPHVYRSARQKGIGVEIIDNRGECPQRDSKADLEWLRPYQRDAVENAVLRQRGIIWAPTGSGKGEMAVALPRVIPEPWLFLVHRSGIMHQTAERYDRRNREHGLALEPASVFGDGRYEVGKRFTVGTFQTVRARIGTPEGQLLTRRTVGVLVDECHVTPSETYARCIDGLKNARFRLGTSGTPLARDDKRSLVAVGALGPVIFRIRSEELIRAGVLSKPEIKALRVEQSVWKPTWQGIYGAAVVRSAVRNGAVANMTMRAEKPCLVFVKELRHGEILKKVLERAGLTVAFVRGATKEGSRSTAKAMLNRGDLDAVIASVVWQEGIDIPELRSVVIASGGKSVIAALQRIGRGMRITDEKQSFEVWDIKDMGISSLEKHSRRRFAAYRSEGYEVIELGDLGI